MKRILTAAVVGLATLALTSCSAAAAESSEVQQWLSERPAAAGDAQASLAGLALKRADIGDTTLEDLGEQIRVDFGAPVHIADVEFTCFGAETMDVSAYIQTGSSYIGSGATDVRCADGPIALDLGNGDDPVSAIRVVGFNHAGAGAWAVTIR